MRFVCKRDSFNHAFAIVRKDSVIAPFVSFAKIVSHHRLSHSDMVKFAAMRLGCDNEVDRLLQLPNCPNIIVNN